MADQKLVNYIKQNQKKGFNLASIERSLISSGYSKEKIDEAIKEIHPRIGFWKKTGLILIKPKELFEKIKQEHDAIHAFNFYAIWAIVFVLLPSLGWAIFKGIFFPTFLSPLLWLTITLSIIGYIISTLSTFFYAGYTFVFLKYLVKIKTEFTQTYKAVTYSLVQPFFFLVIVLLATMGAGLFNNPLFLMVSAGILLLATIIYFIYTLTVGLALLNNISKIKAFVIIIIPVMILLLLATLVGWYIKNMMMTTVRALGPAGISPIIL